MENTDNVRHLNNPLSVAHRVALIIKDLPPGHSRNEAFNLINAAGIKDAKGNPISASMFYHQLTRSAPGSKPRIHDFNPNFVPSLTDNPRTSTNGDVPKRTYDTRGVRITKKQAQRILATLKDMKNDFERRYASVFETMSAYLSAAPDADDAPATQAENQAAASDAPQTTSQETPAAEKQPEPEHNEAPKQPAAKVSTGSKKTSGPHKRKSA